MNIDLNIPKPETLIKLNNDVDNNYNNIMSVKSTYNEDQSQGTYLDKNILQNRNDRNEINNNNNNKLYSIMNFNPHVSKSLSLPNDSNEEEQLAILLVSFYF